MPKTKISEFSATPGNNTDIDGINIAEGCAPSGINDAIRELMAQLKDFQAGTAGDSFNGPVGTTTAAAGAFTTLSASSTVSGAGFSTYLASPPAIGGTAAAAGSFTTLSASGTLSLTGGLSSTSSAISYAVFSSSLANGGRLEIKDGANLVGYIGNGANSIGAASASEFCVNGNSRILFGIAGNSKLTLNSSSFALDSTVSMTVNSGTANGVAYLNGSKVLTTGSALTFDGTSLFVGATSAAAGKLVVKDTASSNTLWLVGRTSDGASSISFRNAADSAYNARLEAVSGQLAFEVNGSEQMRLTSTGLGIGTSSPAAKLHVNGTGSGLLLTGSGYTNNPSGLMLGLYNSTTAYIQQPASASLLFWRGDSSTLMTLDTSGNLGLGVTPSAWETSLSRALQLNGGSLWGYSTSQINVLQNAYYNASGNFVYTNTAAASAYRQISGAHSWLTAASGTAGNTISFTQAMTLDASGNLGVGTTSPNSRLDVTGTSPIISVTPAAQNQNTAIDLRVLNAGTYGAARIAATNASTYDSNLLFYTNTSTSTTLVERARITSGGELLVGTTATTAGARLSVTGVDSTSSNYCMYFENSSSSLLLAVQNDGRWRSGTAAASPYNYVVGATNRDLYVDNGGNIGYVSSVRSSKTNIAPVSNAEWLLQLNPVTFNFRKKDTDGNYTEEADGPLKHGLIAEEVEAINPDMCFYDDTEHGGALRGVNYSSLITPMIKLLQEQQVMINELKAKVAALEAK